MGLGRKLTTATTRQAPQSTIIARRNSGYIVCESHLVWYSLTASSVLPDCSELAAWLETRWSCRGTPCGVNSAEDRDQTLGMRSRQLQQVHCQQTPPSTDGQQLYLAATKRRRVIPAPGWTRDMLGHCRYPAAGTRALFQSRGRDCCEERRGLSSAQASQGYPYDTHTTPTRVTTGHHDRMHPRTMLHTEQAKVRIESSWPIRECAYMSDAHRESSIGPGRGQGISFRS